MSAYRFTSAKRWAVFAAHGDTCYLCKRPLDYTSMHVDHVIPEHLLDKIDELAAVLRSLGKPHDFDLNSFENWLPAHAACNQAKAGRPFEPAPIIVTELARAAAKADLARSIERKTVADRRLGDAIATIERAADLEGLDFKKIEPAIAIFLRVHPEAVRAMLKEQRDTGDFASRLGFELVADPSPVLEFKVTPFASVVYYTDTQVRILPQTSLPEEPVEQER